MSASLACQCRICLMSNQASLCPSPSTNYPYSKLTLLIVLRNRITPQAYLIYIWLNIQKYLVECCSELKSKALKQWPTRFELTNTFVVGFGNIEG